MKKATTAKKQGRKETPAPKTKSGLMRLPDEVTEGNNLLLTTPTGITLRATVRKGLVTKFDAVDESGAKLTVTMARQVAPGEKTTCVVKFCRKYPDGSEACVEYPVKCNDRWFPRL